MALYKNITTSSDDTVTDLIARGDYSKGTIKSITITNIDDKTAENVSVFIEDSAASASTHASNTKFYYCHTVDIPVGASLLLNQGVSFNGAIFSLRIKTNRDADSGTGLITVIIK
tara:strand:- start:177 stop:521 length:345 start_codon:yes stop_codon:yes gene_type:complete